MRMYLVSLTLFRGGQQELGRVSSMIQDNMLFSYVLTYVVMCVQV